MALQDLKRWSLVAGSLALIALAPAATRAQDAGGPPPIMPAGAPLGAGTSDPGFEGLSVTPDASAGYSQSSSTTPGAAGTIDDMTTLEGLINRILELQRDALSAIVRAKTAAYDADAQVAIRDLNVQNGAIEGMLASSTWAETQARVHTFENPATTKNFRWLKIYGPDGHLDVIARQQKEIRDFLKKPALGTPPSPTKAGTTAGTASGTGTAATGTDSGTATGTAAATGTGPATTAPGGTATATTPTEDPIAAVARQIDEISLKIADPNLTKEQKQALEVERNALVQRMAELARKAPGSTDTSTQPATPDGHRPAPAAASSTGTGTAATSSTGASSANTTTAGTGTGTTGTGTANPAAPAVAVPLVANSYGVAPLVLSDAQIRALMDPLIEKELPIENARLSQKGLAVNKYRQLIGVSGKTTIKSVGKPDYDHYAEWIKASPTIKAALDAKATEVYSARAAALAPPAATPATPAPATSGNPQAQTGGATAPESSALPAGSTLPNGKLDLPSTSAR